MLLISAGNWTKEDDTWNVDMVSIFECFVMCPLRFHVNMGIVCA